MIMLGMKTFTMKDQIESVDELLTALRAHTGATEN